MAFLKDMWDFIGGFMALVLSLLILIFRLDNGFRCLTWVGTDYLLGGCFGVAIGLYGRNLVGKIPTLSRIPEAVDALRSMVGWFTLCSAAILLLGIVILLIAAKADAASDKHRIQKRMEVIARGK